MPEPGGLRTEVPSRPGAAAPSSSASEAQDRSRVWAEARSRLEGLPGGGLNIAHEALDRHVAVGTGDVAALRCLRADGRVEDVTYAELTARSARFASALAGLGADRGDVVATLLGRVPEVHTTALGAMRAGCVYAPLFQAFGPTPVQERLALGDVRVLVTTPELYRRKVEPVRDQLPGLRAVVTLGSEDVPGCLPWEGVLAAGDPSFPVVATDPEDPALLHFTSGTTGHPKAVVHVHEAVVAHHATARWVLDLRPGDVAWCTADPGWVTGTSYGVIAPLTHGVTALLDEGELDAARWYGVLQEQRVDVWYTSPTALRMLMRSGDELPGRYDLSSVRLIASVGEPLNPEVVRWTERVLGRAAHDTWWQTETGGIMIAHLAGDQVRVGSMGHPLPGVAAGVLRQGPDGRAAVVRGRVTEAVPGEVGELALKAGWPSMARGYLHDPDRYAACFADGWYLTGDLARVDADGWFWFVGRADDVIKSAGHLIGPFEVESVLLEHPAVAEAGVIGVPDPVVGERVKAFVELRPGWAGGKELERELLGFARARLGAAVAPREVAVRDRLPKTRSGKIVRRLLKARELDLPEGDLSGLEVQP